MDASDICSKFMTIDPAVGGCSIYPGPNRETVSGLIVQYYDVQIMPNVRGTVGIYRDGRRTVNEIIGSEGYQIGEYRIAAEQYDDYHANALRKMIEAM